MSFVPFSTRGSRTARDMACREATWLVAFLIALTAASASCRTLRTPQVDQRYVQQLQPLLEQFVQWQEIPGLAIGIVENNQLLYAHAFGLKHLGGPADPERAGSGRY
jgi:CubicO group peptidase (beta-lactamase class C family)